VGRRVVIALAAVAVGSPVAAAWGRTPAQTLTAALDAGRRHHSVHYVSDSNSRGVRVTMVGDAAVDRGVQRITYRKGGRTGHATVLVVANTAYVRGDAFTLRSYLGFTAGDASEFAGKWLRIPHSAGSYATIAAGVRLSSTIDEIRVPGRLHAVRTRTVAGTRVVGVASVTRAVSGTTTETLYVRAGGAPLPVQETARQGSNTFTVTFGSWDEPVRVSAPGRVAPPVNSA
jgi:hypothetical protein